MTSSFLDIVCAKRRAHVREAKRTVDVNELIAAALAARTGLARHRLREALSRPDRMNIIAEIKRASPSRGEIRADIDVADLARRYQDGGAAAISVLTEPDYFRGSMADLETARGAVDVPLLRKDFMVDAFQIYEAAAAGADAVLLIAAALSDEELSLFRQIAEVELGLDAIVEVHDLDELERAINLGAKIIGANNRDLKTLEISLDVSRELIRYKPKEMLMIAESGLSQAVQLHELQSLGFDGFLIGESLMRSDNAAATLGGWV